MNSENVEISVIVPVSERYDGVESIYKDYKKVVADIGKSFEFIYVLDGKFLDVLGELEKLQAQGERITIIQLAKWFGEATALTAGFDNSSGDVILTLPAYYQIEPKGIAKIVEGLKDHDMAIAQRWPRMDSKINQFQSKIFNSLLNIVTGSSYHDLGCSIRAFKRQVADEIPVYGDQHRFFPLLANRRGFKVVEINVEQSVKDQNLRIYRPGVYPRRILDIMTVFFLVKFTKKPLRFFGLVGMTTFAVGGVFLLYLIIERLFFGGALADRPALLLSSLLVVLGVQVFALGLIGELIIFTHAKEIKEYTVETIINE